MSSQPHNPTPQGSSPPLATAELLERCMGNPGVALLVLEKFEKQLHNDLPEIERLTAAGDAAQVARTCHSLKGAAGAVASDSIQRIAAELETLAKQSRLDSIAQQVASLRTEVERVLAYLPAARGTLKSAEARP
jgi:HPt (histidine-containing phosphotransfer) domain-containing protein